MFPIQLGLKASCDLEQMKSRLKYHPDVFVSASLCFPVKKRMRIIA